MTAFPDYDSASDTIRLNGGANILLTLLMKSKFGERFDPETLFHADLSTLIEQLYAAVGFPKPTAGECFDRTDLLAIADTVLAQSANIGWWLMSETDRRAFLQRAATPWMLSEEQLQTIIEDVGDLLLRHREVVAAADAANEAR